MNPPVARLLIVDDEAAQMMALCRTLETEGYYTTGFTSANDAVAALSRQSFDLMLTDLMMPEMDGIALVRTALESDPNLACIVMTGHGTIDTAVEAMKAGALDYILKPFKLSVASAVLLRALRVRSLRLENAELMRRVTERTVELEAANKELEAFSYSVSHDLRNPLSAVLGFSQLLAEDYLIRTEPRAQQMLRKISNSAERMEQLITDLLRLSSLGRQPISKQKVETGALVREVLDGLAQANAARQIELRVQDLPDCVADASLLKQVFVNLLSNAFKFSRRRQIAIIEVGWRLQDLDLLYFVRDNGAGFDAQFAQKLFDAFQRLHSYSDFEGTGVGLSIVKRIVMRHGGRIWAEGEVERGATFYFTLPAVPALNETAYSAQSGTHAAG